MRPPFRENLSLKYFGLGVTSYRRQTWEGEGSVLAEPYEDAVEVPLFFPGPLPMLQPS